MLVTLTRVDKENNMPMGLVSMLDTELESSADVVFLLADKSVVKAHKCFLSVSPVLKEVLMSLDCRLDKVVHISMPDFDRRTVLSFIQFLYKGFVDLDSNYEEFYRLFQALKVNPPVITERRPSCVKNVEKVKEVGLLIDEGVTVIDNCNTINNNEKQETVVMEGDVDDQTEEIRNDAPEAREIKADVKSMLREGKITKLMTASSQSEDLVTTSSLSGGLVSRVASASSDGKDVVRNLPSQLPVKKSNGFSCLHCGKVLATKLSWQVHNRDIHEKSSESITCKICGKVFKSRNSLSSHKSVYHKDFRSMNLLAANSMLMSANNLIGLAVPNSLSGGRVEASSLSGRYVKAKSLSGRHVKANSLTGLKVAASNLPGGGQVTDDSFVPANRLSGRHVEAKNLLGGQVTDNSSVAACKESPASSCQQYQQSVQIIRGADGKEVVRGLVPSQQLVKMPDGEFKILSDKSITNYERARAEIAYSQVAAAIPSMEDQAPVFDDEGKQFIGIVRSKDGKVWARGLGPDQQLVKMQSGQLRVLFR